MRSSGARFTRASFVLCASAVLPAGSAAAAEPPPPPSAPLITATWAYDGGVATCVTGVRAECATCLGGGTCEPIWSMVSGADACTTLEAGPSNYQLLCINLAVSLGDVGVCLQRDLPGCTFDTSAILRPGDLRVNVAFADDPTCRDGLDACLIAIYGSDPADDGGCCTVVPGRARGAGPAVSLLWALVPVSAVLLARRRARRRRR